MLSLVQCLINSPILLSLKCWIYFWYQLWPKMTPNSWKSEFSTDVCFLGFYTMVSSNIQLEQQLMDFWTKLINHPSVDKLQSLLYQVKNCLSKVEQFPTKSMQSALTPSMKALAAQQPLKHSTIDVKVAAASCNFWNNWNNCSKCSFWWWLDERCFTIDCLLIWESGSWQISLIEPMGKGFWFLKLLQEFIHVWWCWILNAII